MGTDGIKKTLREIYLYTVKKKKKEKKKKREKNKVYICVIGSVAVSPCCTYMRDYNIRTSNDCFCITFFFFFFLNSRFHYIFCTFNLLQGAALFRIIHRARHLFDSQCIIGGHLQQLERRA
jgi:hypothetical protein